MSSVSDEMVHAIAARVAGRILAPSATRSPAARYAVLAVSNDGPALARTAEELAQHRAPCVVVADCPTAAAGAIATIRARHTEARILDGEAAFDVDATLNGADRVLAPSMSLALASRVASLQPDFPAASVIVRALLHGVPVEASLDDRDFAASEHAVPGARRAVQAIAARLVELGISLPRPNVAVDHSSARDGHPSRDRYAISAPLDEFIDFLESRTCTIDGSSKCNGCGACEMRGF